MKDKQTKEVWDSAKQPNTVIESVTDGITLSDANGHFEVFNSKMQELTGYTLGEANSCADFSALVYPEPDRRREALQRLDEVRQGGRIEEIETVIQAKDGFRKVLLVSTTLLKYKNEDMFLTVYHDITLPKLNEEELKKAREKLEI